MNFLLETGMTTQTPWTSKQVFMFHTTNFHITIIIHIRTTATTTLQVNATRGLFHEHFTDTQDPVQSRYPD